MPSFYSDRTAEYALVSKFAEILKPLGSVVPIYYAGQREDTHVAYETQQQKRFYLVAFFARRPKIDRAESQSIEGKIHKQLFNVGRRAAALGIPTFCGISLTNNIFHQMQSEPLWFDISETAYDEDMKFRCEINSPLNLEVHYGHLNPMDQSSVLSKVASGQTLDWSGVISIMKELPKFADDYQPKFMFLSQTWRYKPIYFAIQAT